MEAEQVIQGRRLGPEDIDLIRHWLATEPGWNRTRLSRELCRRWNYSSDALHCDSCSALEHRSGPITYYHSAITLVIVAPGQRHAIALRQEFITPQDGHGKQDCEIAAAKRWLDKEAARYLAGLGNSVTLLGDDRYAHQPFCRRALLQRYHFIFTCKPDSHTHLYHAFITDRTLTDATVADLVATGRAVHPPN